MRQLLKIVGLWVIWKLEKDKGFILSFSYKLRVTKLLMKVYFYRYVLVDKWKKKNRMNTSHLVIPNELLTPQNEKQYVLPMKYRWSRLTHTHTHTTATTASTTTKPEFDDISRQKYKGEETYRKQSKSTNCRKQTSDSASLSPPPSCSSLLPSSSSSTTMTKLQRGKNVEEECIDY